jgi:hypothetical protein
MLNVFQSDVCEELAKYCQNKLRGKEVCNFYEFTAY